MAALPPFAAVIVAAGKGLRAGGAVPKQFADWRGKPLVRHSAEAFARLGAGPIVVAVPADALVQAQQVLSGIDIEQIVSGGPSRRESVARALEALAPAGPAMVLIHDAARPDLPRSVVERLLGALATQPGAIPVLPVVDSIAVAAGGLMASAARREELRRVQTPQAFRYADILAAHRAWDARMSA